MIHKSGYAIKHHKIKPHRNILSVTFPGHQLIPLLAFNGNDHWLNTSKYSVHFRKQLQQQINISVTICFASE